jgi:xanthine dehydrogenase accessory factor
VVAEAIDAIRAGENRQVRYGRGSKYFDIVLPCGSAIELFFDVHLDCNDLARIAGAMAGRTEASLTIPAHGASPSLVRHFEPERRLVVIGVGPSAVGLARLGAQAGFETVLYSPDDTTRSAAEMDGIAAVRLTRTASPDYRADRRTAVVFMFHDHEWERQLVPAALRSEAFYIGALGSRTTHERRVERLRQLGFTAADIARIHGPAGIFAGGKSMQDIAVSILAEVIQADLAGPSLRSPESSGHAETELLDV